MSLGLVQKHFRQTWQVAVEEVRSHGGRGQGGTNLEDQVVEGVTELGVLAVVGVGNMICTRTHAVAL